MGVKDNAISIFEEQRELTDEEMQAYKDMLRRKENDMGAKIRTEMEIKAYIDGYNESFNKFRECLNIRPLWKAIREMEKWVRAVNSIVEVDTNDSNT